MNGARSHSDAEAGEEPAAVDDAAGEDAVVAAAAQPAHFRRQHAIGPYILDFYCATAQLCVEVDGLVHAEQAAHDERRTRWLAEQGIRVIRFSVGEVETHPAAVIAAIVRAAAPSTA